MFKNIHIRPNEEGTRMALYDLEADIMDVVWSRGWEAFSVRDVLEELLETRSIAYTTVMTTVSRLFDKGLLEREMDGRRYMYSPVVGRDEFQARVALEVMTSLPDAGREVAMSMLIDEMSRADDGALDRLERLLAEHRQNVDN